MDDVGTRPGPGVELIELWRHRPLAGAPVCDWVAWLEPQPALLEQIAAGDPTSNARAAADHVRGMVKDLRERYELTEPWPGEASW